MYILYCDISNNSLSTCKDNLTTFEAKLCKWCEHVLSGMKLLITSGLRWGHIILIYTWHGLQPIGVWSLNFLFKRD